MLGDVLYPRRDPILNGVGDDHSGGEWVEPALCQATEDSARGSGQGKENVFARALDGGLCVILSGLPGHGEDHVAFKDAPPPANSGALLVLLVLGSFMV